MGAEGYPPVDDHTKVLIREVMRIDRLTTQTRAALVAAQEAATSAGNPEILPEHLLVALLEDPSVFARLAAIDGLCRLGDKKYLPALRRSRREESWDHLQRTADRAIAQLTKGRGKKRKR